MVLVEVHEDMSVGLKEGRSGHDDQVISWRNTQGVASVGSIVPCESCIAKRGQSYLGLSLSSPIHRHDD